MPRAALTEDEIGAFREKITAAATHLFAQKGFEAVTMRAIAAEIGCSPMTAYRYFEGKDEIFESVRAEAFARLADNQEAAAARPFLNAAARMAALGHAYARFALADPDAYRVMFELTQPEAPGDAEISEQGLRAWAPMYEAVCACVAEGSLQGDALTLAHIAWAQIHGLVTLHLSNKLQMGRTIEELIDTAVADMLPKQSKS